MIVISYHEKDKNLNSQQNEARIIRYTKNLCHASFVKNIFDSVDTIINIFYFQPQKSAFFIIKKQGLKSALLLLLL